MPRPFKEDPRDYFKTFRFTQAELTRLENRARASGRTLSSYVRMILLDRQGDEPVSGTLAGSPIQRPGNDRSTRILVEQMRKVGVNLNQIAHRMNERRTPPPRELTMILDEIRTYVRQTREL